MAAQKRTNDLVGITMRNLALLLKVVSCDNCGADLHLNRSRKLFICNKRTYRTEPTRSTKRIKGEKAWDDHFWKIWLLGAVVPLIFMWFVIPCRGYVYFDPVGGLGMEYEDWYLTPTLKLSSTMFSVIAAILFGSLTMFNTVAILVLLKAKSKISEKECGLVYFEILMAFVTMVFAATQTVLYFSKNVLKDPYMQHTVDYIRTYVIDIFILPNAWTILIFSKNVRRGVKAIVISIVQCRKTTIPVITVKDYSKMPSSFSRNHTVSTF